MPEYVDIDGPLTTNLISNAPENAVVNRVNDRLLIGGAAANDAAYPNVEKDWFTRHEVCNGRANGIIVSSQSAVLTSESPGARVALVAAAQTATVSSDTGYVQSLSFSAVQNRTSSLIPITAGYAEGWRMDDEAGSVICLELDPINLGDYREISPFAQDAKQSVALQLAAGGEVGEADASAAINIRANGTKFGKGIVFGNDSIRGSDGVSGQGEAIAFATHHAMGWRNAAGEQTGVIMGQTANVDNRTGVGFIDLGCVILGPTNNVLVVFRPVPDVANYLDVRAGQAGHAVEIGVTGADDDVSLRLRPQGEGTV